MAIPTDKAIKAVSYNGTDIPLVGGSPTGNVELTQQSGTDVSQYATASVRSGSISLNNPTVSSSGLIISSASLGTSGWIGAAPSDKTLQLTTQAAKTVTPSASSQTAVAANRYTTGAVTVAEVPSETKNVTANGTVTPSTGKWLSSVTVNVPQGIPIDVSTASGMNAVLTAANVGKAYRFTGTSDATYTNGDIYVVEAT